MGAIALQEVVNPTFLEDAFQIPLGWTDPLELRAATELLGTAEKPSEIVLTPESQRSLSSESSISTALLKTEEELTPVDETAVGRHYWCDRLDVTVTVETVHNWRTSPRATDLTKAARCRPWWGKFPDVMVIVLEDLVEIEKLSCLMEERPVERQPSRSQISAISSPEIPVRPITGISSNPIPDGDHPRSLEKTDLIKQRGCLTQYAPSKKGVRYPKVEGRRDKFNDTHWYWNFGWKEKDEDGEERKSRSVPVKLCHLAEVRRAIAEGKPYTYTLREILGKD
jgi:hypothetical protein